MSPEALYRAEMRKRGARLERERQSLLNLAAARYQQSLAADVPKPGRPRKVHDGGEDGVTIRPFPDQLRKKGTGARCNNCGNNPRARGSSWCQPCKRVAEQGRAAKRDTGAKKCGSADSVRCKQ